MGTKGHEDLGTWGRGNVGTWERGNVRTRGRGDVGTWGRGDAGTRDRGRGAVKIGDARSGTRGGEKQKEPFSASNVYKIQFPENQWSLALRPPPRPHVPPYKRPHVPFLESRVPNTRPGLDFPRPRPTFSESRVKGIM